MSSKKQFNVGLVFPEIGRDTLETFEKVLKNSGTSIDMLVFPEGFEEAVVTAENSDPSKVRQTKEIQDIIKKYQRFSDRNDMPLFIGIEIGSTTSKDKSKNELHLALGENDYDSHAMFISPGKKPVFYHKHSTAKYKAFNDDNWSIENNFPVVKVGQHKVGFTLCYDFFISPIPRIMKEKGMDIYVNMSYNNVREQQWEAMLQARSAENDVLVVGPLHRDSKKHAPQKEPYAFSPEGKIILSSLTSGEEIGDIPKEERTGQIFFFDAHSYRSTEYDMHAKKYPKPKNAHTLRDTKIPPNGNYYMAQVSLQDFLFKPEKLWQLAEKAGDKTPLFMVKAQSNKEWDKYKDVAEKVIRARAMEFSTLFLITAKDQGKLVGYRSSNYKNVRVTENPDLPLHFDPRFLMGPESTLKIVRSDPRGINVPVENRFQQMVDALTQKNIRTR